MNEIVKLQNLKKTYNPGSVPVVAVNDVSLSFDEGEFVAIVGASGSGKTTLLNMIGGITKPTQGSVWINGQDIIQKSEEELTDFRRINIGFIFQQYNLLPVLTAQENVEFMMELNNVKQKSRIERAQYLLRAVGLEDKLGFRPSQLSGGQQQRVAVARALANKPKFIIADEPTANLDSKSASDLLDLMVVLNQEERTTFIFSTHDQRVVDKAKRVIVFEDGKVKSDNPRK